MKNQPSPTNENYVQPTPEIDHGRLLSRIAHDLGHLLQGVGGAASYAAALLQEKADLRKVYDSLTVIEDYARHGNVFLSNCGLLIGESLFLQKETGSLAHHVVLPALHQLRSVKGMDSRPLTLNEEGLKGLPLLNADLDLLKRAFFNLFSHSVDARRPGRPRPYSGTAPRHVDLLAEMTAKGLRIRCSFPGQRQEEFARKLTQEETQGAAEMPQWAWNSLGLRAAARIVEAHGGTLLLGNNGPPATILFDLPSTVMRTSKRSPRA